MASTNVKPKPSKLDGLTIASDAPYSSTRRLGRELADDAHEGRRRVEPGRRVAGTAPAGDHQRDRHARRMQPLHGLDRDLDPLARLRGADERHQEAVADAVAAAHRGAPLGIARRREARADAVRDDDDALRRDPQPVAHVRRRVLRHADDPLRDARRVAQVDDELRTLRPREGLRLDQHREVVDGHDARRLRAPAGAAAARASCRDRRRRASARSRHGTATLSHHGWRQADGSGILSTRTAGASANRSGRSVSTTSSSAGPSSSAASACTSSTAYVAGPPVMPAIAPIATRSGVKTPRPRRPPAAGRARGASRRRRRATSPPPRRAGRAARRSRS